MLFDQIFNNIYYLIFAIIAALAKFMLEKFKNYFNKENKIIKSSDLIITFLSHNAISFICIMYSMIAYIIIGFLISIISYLIFDIDLEQKDLMFIFAYTLCISTLIQNFFSKEFKKIITEAYSIIKKRILLNKILFSTPKLLFLILMIYSSFNNNKLGYIGFVILLFILIITCLHFSAIKIYDKYNSVKIYFKNSTPTTTYIIKDYSVKDGYICINDILDSTDGYTKSIRYNKDDISKIEYIYNDNINDDYKKTLDKKGFNV